MDVLLVLIMPPEFCSQLSHRFCTLFHIINDNEMTAHVDHRENGHMRRTHTHKIDKGERERDYDEIACTRSMWLI